MANSIAWQLLFVDDDANICRQVQEYLEEEVIAGSDKRLCIETLTDFDVALDRLEAHRFDLLILDVRLGSHEKTPPEEAGITTLDAIKKMQQQNITILLVEHNMKILDLCERVVVIDFGQKIAEGPPKEVRENKEVIKAYFGGERVT